MSGKIFRFTRMFGVANGVKLYLSQKYNKHCVVKVPFLRHPVHFRGQKSKSDFEIFKQIFYTKDYEISVPIDPKAIIDLGANAGFASIYFANRFPHSRIIALEPDGGNYSVALENVKAYNNIELIQGAIWNKSEQIHLVDRGLGEAAFMIEPGKGKNVVQAFTVSEIIKMFQTELVDILKIDIEGSEKEIFEQGFEEWLPFTKILIVETHDRYRQGSSKAVLKAVSAYNFSLELSGENLVFYNNNLINSTLSH